MSTAANRETATDVMQRALHEERLHRIPKHPERRDIVLALMSSFLERRYPYTELELNETLKEVLERFAADFDHVTCRRYLVDLGFLKRDRAGQRYFLNFPKLEATLSEAVRENVEALVQEAFAAARDRRKRRAGS